MAKRRKKTKKRYNRKSMAFITIIVAVLLVSLSVQSYQLKQRNLVYADQMAELEQQMKEENGRTEDIEKLKDYMDTDEYVEDVARDKLGMVKEDEILLKPEN